MKKIFTLLCFYQTTLLAQFPETLDLSGINGQDGFVFNGANAFDFTGYAVSSAGDVNGDGVTDFIVGAIGADSAGKVYLIFGQETDYDASYQVSDLVNNFGLIIENPVSNGLMGWSVSGLGDVNGDGIDDMIIGDNGFDGDAINSGKVYVVFGDASGFSGGIDLAQLNGENGFSMTKATTTGNNNQLGRSVSSAGDINHDGFLDIAVAAPYDDFDGITNTGLVFVIYGTDQGFPAEFDLDALTTTTGFQLTGEFEIMDLGMHVRSLGDVNGDGIDDLGLSTNIHNDSTQNRSFAFVLYGSDSGFPVEFNMVNIDGSNGFRIYGPEPVLGFTGFSKTVIFSAGDLNGDGRADISIGSINSVSNGTEPFVLFGRSSDFPADVQLNNLDGNTGFSILNIDPISHNIGEMAGTVGDINSDGIDDLFIGISDSDTTESLGFMIFGSKNLDQSTFDLASLNGQNGFKISGPSNPSSNALWVSMAALDDMNGDGINDFALGNGGAESNGNRAGAAYVVFGKQPDLIFKNDFE